MLRLLAAAAALLAGVAPPALGTSGPETARTGTCEPVRDALHDEAPAGLPDEALDLASLHVGYDGREVVLSIGLRGMALRPYSGPTARYEAEFPLGTTRLRVRVERDVWDEQNGNVRFELAEVDAHGRTTARGARLDGIGGRLDWDRRRILARLDVRLLRRLTEVARGTQIGPFLLTTRRTTGLDGAPVVEADRRQGRQGWLLGTAVCTPPLRPDQAGEEHAGPVPPPAA